jgi:alpha-L-arabinofuranosidase
VAQDYHCLWGVGPRDQRPVWVNKSWGNELEPSDFGTDEFVQFARRVGAEPSITVNVEGQGATADEVAAWVQYCNGDPKSKYGQIRASNGSPEPFHVRYWEVGNEIWGDWVARSQRRVTYANNLNRYVEKMKANRSLHQNHRCRRQQSRLELERFENRRALFFPLLAYPPKTYIGAAPGNRLLRLHLRRPRCFHWYEWRRKDGE